MDDFSHGSFIQNCEPRSKTCLFLGSYGSALGSKALDRTYWHVELSSALGGQTFQPEKDNDPFTRIQKDRIQSLFICGLKLAPH
jgi:hypothetical protein